MATQWQPAAAGQTHLSGNHFSNKKVFHLYPIPVLKDCERNIFCINQRVKESFILL